SNSRFSMSLSLYVPFAFCTASSFSLTSMLLTSSSAPSAVCISEMPSCAFLAAWLRPLICALIFSEMDRPAASSAARFILFPDDSFSMDLPAAVFVTNSWFLVLIAEMLLLIIIRSSSSSLNLLPGIHSRLLPDVPAHPGFFLSSVGARLQLRKRNPPVYIISAIPEDRFSVFSTRIPGSFGPLVPIRLFERGEPAVSQQIIQVGLHIG